MNKISGFFKRLFFKTDYLKKTLRSKVVVIIVGASAIGAIFYSILRDNPVQITATLSPAKFEVSRIAPLSTQPSPSPSNSEFSKYTGGPIGGGITDTTPKPLPKLGVLEPAHKFPPGKFFKAKLMTGGDSGLIYALLDGQKLKGQAQSQKDRLQIHFDQLLANSPTPISADAFDPEDQKLGITGKVLSTYGLKLATALGLHFTAGMSEALQERESMGLNGSVKKNSVKNALLNGTVNAASEEAKELLSQARGEASRVDVEAGKDILIMFHPQ